MLYEVNLGIREYFTYTDAMLSNSLFSRFLQQNGMDVYKGAKNISNKESTRDIVCLDFDFGSRSYDDELDRLTKLLDRDLTDDARERIERAIDNATAKKDLYRERKRSEIRDLFYNEGVDITYKTKNKDGTVKDEETIHYRMLYRTSAKAKLGQVIFINEKLYDRAYDWLTMGLGKKMPDGNAKIVELSAYTPLTTSTIIDRVHIPATDILILQDQDSCFKTFANVVKSQPYTDKNGNSRKKCIVVQEETDVKNTLWDGMGIIESYLLPKWVNGMALLRNHLFKMCGIRGHIQLFFRDWCKENGHDYETYQVRDMFGNLHFLKDIKMITTHNAVKWTKFTDLMGGTPASAYSYWCDRVHRDGDVWGIVKTDHPSKLGQYQQLSYQMLNTLPCTREDVRRIAQTSIDYVESLKNDNDAFERFLRKNANEVNHYEMLADLYRQNNDFSNCKWFREEKRKIISQYVSHLRKGKIFVSGDNLTVFGNPYALLLYAVGDDWKKDPTLNKEEGAVQCYTNRFSDGEYLAAFRNPHNSPNNICHMHNVYSSELQKYFVFSNNVVAINCIKTDIQDRANGMDEDSDFMLFTDHPVIVDCARRSYLEYPTVVNALRESGITYRNTMTDYANMDNKLSGSRMGIGWSSNLAQLAMTYYWTEMAKDSPDREKLQELYNSFIILSVLAQVIIDGCKREYEINGMEEIKRISRLIGDPKSLKCNFPRFMKYTREIPYTKDGKELPHEEIREKREKLDSRINADLQCPMNWLEEWLDKIQNISSTNCEPTEKYFIKMKGYGNNRQITQIRKLIEEYDNFIKHGKIVAKDTRDFTTEMISRTNELLEKLSRIKIGNIVTINRLIETSLGLEQNNNKSLSYRNGQKYTRKMLNMLYRMNRQNFLMNFISASEAESA